MIVFEIVYYGTLVPSEEIAGLPAVFHKKSVDAAKRVVDTALKKLPALQGLQLSQWYRAEETPKAWKPNFAPPQIPYAYLFKGVVGHPFQVYMRYPV